MRGSDFVPFFLTTARKNYQGRLLIQVLPRDILEKAICLRRKRCHNLLQEA